MRFYVRRDAIDLSWQYMLHEAFLRHLQWGTQIVWTYGPIGFLDVVLPFLNQSTEFWALSVNIVTRILFSIVFPFLIIDKKVKDMTSKEILMTLLYIILCFISISRLFLSMIIALFVILVQIKTLNYDIFNKKVALLTVLNGFLLAFATMIKLNILPLSVADVFLLFIAGIFIQNKRKFLLYDSAVAFVSFIAGILILWIATEQRISHLPAFLERSYWIIKGYTPAMFVYGNPLTDISAFLMMGYCLYILLITKDRIKQLHLLLLYLFMFLAFKEGFTVNSNIIYQDHALTFYTAMILIPPAMYSIIQNRYKILLTLALANAVFIISMKEINNLRVSQTPVFHIRTKNPEIILQKFYGLRSSFVKTINHHSVTVLPWDLLMAYPYHFNIKFLPDPQLYQTYTANLDSIDARAVKTQNIRYIVYSYQDLYPRYPLYSTPATYRSIFECYKVKIPGNMFTLLERKPCASQNLIPVETITAHFGQWISVPQNKHIVYAGIYIYPSVFNGIINLLYKPLSTVHMYFKVNNRVFNYRIIPDVLKNGVFIRYFIQNQKDFNSLMENKINRLQRIQAFKIQPRGPNLNYENAYEIVFYTVR